MPTDPPQAEAEVRAQMARKPVLEDDMSNSGAFAAWKHATDALILRHAPALLAALAALDEARGREERLAGHVRSRDIENEKLAEALDAARREAERLRGECNVLAVALECAKRKAGLDG